MHADDRDYCRRYDICQITGKLSRRDEMSLVPQVTLREFYKWAVYFMGPINPPGRRMGARYIITATYYLTIWDEATLVKDSAVVSAERFLFDHVVTRFGCPQILVSVQGTHFVN